MPLEQHLALNSCFVRMVLHIRQRPPATEGDEVREKVYNNTDVSVPRASDIIDRIILFMTVHEALEFCEGTLIHQFHDKSAESSGYRNFAGPKEHTLSSAFAQMLESDQEE